MYLPGDTFVNKVYLQTQIASNLERIQVIHPAFDTRRGAHSNSMDSTEEIKLIKLLLERLERVSVDSYWAHRASGIRGGLLKKLEELEKEMPAGQSNTREIISSAFDILTRAAREKH